MQSLVRAGVALVLTLGLAVPAAASAADPFAITSFDGRATDVSGAPLTQAGAHPDLTTSFLFAVRVTGVPGQGNGGLTPLGSVKDTVVDLPAGLVGNPIALPQCANDDLDTVLLFALCPTDSQVGLATLYGSQFSAGPDQTGRQFAQAPIYNMVPTTGEPAQFAFNVAGVLVRISPSLRADGNYALSATVHNASQSDPIDGASITLWGVPGDAAHDAERIDTVALHQGAPSHLGRKPLITNPVSCTGPLTVSLRANTWQFPGTYAMASFVTHDNETPANPIGVTGCEKLSFLPSLDAVPTTQQPDAPTGLNVRLGFAQNESPDGLATAQLRDAQVTLPDGMTINPAAAGGLQACTDEQIALGSYRPVQCPEASKVGEATATTPLLKEPLGGSIYIGSQKSSDPASGQMFRLFLRVLDKERGIDVRLPGQVRVDPATGRIVARFIDNPQIPVSDIKLTFKSGPRAPLVTPPTCGTKAINAELTSWSGQSAIRPSSFDVACTAGLGGFAPSLTAGTATTHAGAFSPFGLSITKPDGNADINGLMMSLPTGLLAKLKGNIGTQVGTVKAFAGPGTNPFALPGKVFLEGAYGDAPFSLRVEVPAKAGPFDLGTVTVRQKIYVDPIDAHVTVVSDPVPTIVSGVPVRLQRLDVNVDKPGFIINPTSCVAKAIGGTLAAADGQTAPINVRFQVGGCADLALKPSLGLALSGKGQTTDGKHPAVTATLTQPAGQANLKKVRVTLPLSLALDTENANGLCEFVDGSKASPTCPKDSIVGTATATTPILDEPLAGPVYFVKNVRKDPKSGREIRTLPKLVIPLVGQNGVKLTLTGTSDVVDDRLVTTFDNIPDAPVSGFKLSIIGGKGGILVVSGDKADICKATQVADQQVLGQNTKTANADVFIQTPSCPLKILSKKVGKRSVAIKVGGLGAGKVTVTGKGIKKTSKTITKSTVATITAKRSKAKPGKVTVSFDPTGPAKAHKVSK
jgi:hypothetical protein